MPDGRLLKSIACGDRHAFDELYRRYYRRLGGYLAQRLPPSYSTDEIIDDTFMIVWQHAGEFRYQSQVSTWIFGIAYRVALKSLRRNKRWLTAADEDAPELAFDPTREAEEHDWLAEGLRRLPDKQRLSILLSYQLGHSIQQVAAITKSSTGTVKARMFLARRKLRHLLLALQ
jgi:RNA polymerase sigma-70 factor (ECF subfamily)